MHIADVQTRHPDTSCAMPPKSPAPDALVVPMLKEDELIGVDRYLPPGGSALHRQADRAGQELRRPGRHRHREHAAAQTSCAKSAVQQQTATADVLKVISSSPGELEPVFEPCWRTRRESVRGQVRHSVHCREGDAFRTVATAR